MASGCLTYLNKGSVNVSRYPGTLDAEDTYNILATKFGSAQRCVGRGSATYKLMCQNKYELMELALKA